MVKRISILLLIAFISLMISFCCSQQKKIKIAVVGRIETPYWNNMKLGAEAAGSILGVSVKFLAPSKEDPAWQIKKIEELIDESVDGIAFAASDPKTIAPIVLKAMQSEIPCIALDTDVGKSRHLYIGTRNYLMGQRAGERMVSLLDGEGKVVVVADSFVNPDSLQHVRGFKDILAEYININVITTLDKESGAVQVSDVEDLLRPDLKGIFCASDSCALVVSEAVKRASKTGLITIVCIGESDDVMILVRDNVIQAAIARKPYNIGYLAVLALFNMAKVGINNALMIMPEGEIIDPGIVMVTPQNIIQYREQLKRLGIDMKF